MNSIVHASANDDIGQDHGTTPGSPPPNPFVGPVPLDVGQKLHGRRRETEELSDLLLSKRIVLLFSPSGAGKTSLIRAGLIPRLKESYEMEALPVIRLGHRDPSCDGDASINRYRLATLLALETLREEGERRPARDLRAYTLKQYFEECVSAAIGRDSAGEPHYPLLILDQFEELFTADPLDVRQKREFLEELGSLLRGGAPGRWGGETGVPVWALFAMREDHLAELQPYLDLIPTALAFRYRMDALGVDAARDAIAETAGTEWMAADVPQRLVDDLCRVSVRGADGAEAFQPGRFVEPVQLQVVCRGLWQKVVIRQGRKIEAGDVQSSSHSEVDRALGDFFDQEVAAAAADTGVSERKLREWIESQLISTSGVRIQCLRDTNLLGRTDDAISQLVDVHLLRIDPHGGHEWIKLPHDRLVAPVRAANKAWALEHLQRFQKQAAYWQQATGEHARSLLLSEEELATARAYAASHAEDLTQDEIGYLDASQQEIARSAREAERLRRERRRRIAMTCAFATVLLGMLAAWAFIEHARQAGQLEVQSRQIRKQELREKGQDIFSAIGQAWGNGWTGGVLAAMLAQRGAADDVDKEPSSGLPNMSRYVYDAILKQLGVSPAALVHELQPRTHVVWSLAFTNDGTRLLAGSWDGHISVQDVAADGANAFETRDLKTVTYAVAVAGAGGLVASTHGDGSARLWRLNQGELQPLEELVPSTDNEHRLTTADFSDDSRWLAIAGWGKNVELWDFADPSNPVHATSFRISGAPILSITFLPGTGKDGQLRLATTDYDGVVRLWSIGEGVPIDPKRPLREFSIQDHEGRRVGISAAAADPSGRFFVAGDTEGNVHVWDLDSDDRTRNGILLGRATYGDGPDDMAVKGIAFAPQSNEFVSVGVDGYVVRWTLPEHPSGLADIADGTTQQHFRIGDRERLYSVAYRPHKPGQIAVGATRKILLLDLDRGTGPALSTPLPGSSAQTAWQTVSMDAAGTRIAARTYVRHPKDDQTVPIKLWLREQGRIREMPEWTLAEAVTSSLAMAPDGQYLITVDCHGLPTEWPLRAGTQPGPLHMSGASGPNDCGNQSVAIPPAFSPDGRMLATADGQTLRLWNRGVPGADAWSEMPADHLRQPADDKSKAPTDERISTLAFSADSRYLAAGVKSGYLRLLKVEDSRSGSSVAQVAAVDVGQRVSVLAFNPDGTKLLVGGDDGILTQWTLPTLAMDGAADARHVRSITGAAYAWDRGAGERPMHVTAGADGYVVAWSPWNKNLKNAIDLTQRGSSPVRAIALSRDGTFLVTAGDDMLGWNLAPDHVLDVAKAYADRRYREPGAQP